MTNDYNANNEVAERVSVTRWGAAELGQALGRIEATLIDMRRDIQEGNVAQAETMKAMSRLDLRVIRLENKEEQRTRVSRIGSVIALALLIPALNAVSVVHGWFDGVSKVCFPGNKPGNK